MFTAKRNDTRDSINRQLQWEHIPRATYKLYSLIKRSNQHPTFAGEKYENED